MRKNIVALLLSICWGFPTTGSESAPPDPMRGRIDTGRTIHFEIVVPCSRRDLFRLWTTEEGVRTFFAPRSRIDPRVGGRYEMIFAPDIDPEGENQGTKGSRLLGIEQDRFIAFEWITFVLKNHPNGSGPPAVSAEERNQRPLPTWVEIELADVLDDPLRTRLRFEHKGFRSGGAWDDAIPYFWRQWGAVLGRLGASCSPGTAPSLRDTAESTVKDPPIELPAAVINRGRTMERVSGIGGLFFRAEDPTMLTAWYEQHFGVSRVPAEYDQDSWWQQEGPTVFAPFPQNTKYFGRQSQAWMVNFRVRDLDAIVTQLQAAGIEVEVDQKIYPNGRFARLHDPEGNPIELWQPAGKDATRPGTR